MHTDGDTSKEGSRARLILKNPNDDEIMYALCFNFQVSTNEVEYKALLSSLQVAQEVGAKHLADLGDSLLITNQVNGTYEANDQRMKMYLNIV